MDEIPERQRTRSRNLLLDTETLADWKNILALVVAQKYDCFAIKEDNISSTDETTYKYYVYGEPSDVAIAKQLFHFVYGEVNRLIKENCFGRGQLYTDSFAEGVVHSARVNIEYENFDTAGVVKAAEPKQEVKKDALEVPAKEPTKPPPIENKVNVSNKEKPMDIQAYWLGLDLGDDIHIGKVDIKKFSSDAINFNNLFAGIDEE